MSRFRLVLVVVALLAPRVFGWGHKEHIQMTRIAASDLLAREQTPPEMKAWLRTAVREAFDMEAERAFFTRVHVGVVPRGVDGLPWWATMPDMVVALEKGDKAPTTGPSTRRGARPVQPFGVFEDQLHFTDLEYLNADPARRVFAADLSNRPKLADIPRDMKDPRWLKAGLLPFRIEDCFAKTVEQLRAGRLDDKAGQFPRDEHACKWAGFLAHYTQDSFQPHHSTADYRSQSFVPDRGADVHGDFEWRMGDDPTRDYAKLRTAYWDALAAALEAEPLGQPTAAGDIWTGVLERLIANYEHLPTIGRAAVQARATAADAGVAPEETYLAAFFAFNGSLDGKPASLLAIKARLQARAIRQTQQAWLGAWAASHPPAAPANR